MHSPRILISLFSALALIACTPDSGDDDDNGGNNGTGGSQAGSGAFDGETFATRAGDAFCGVVERCFPELEEAFIGPDCASDMAESFRSGAPILAAAIEAGRASYDDAAFQACLRTVNSTGCEAFSIESFGEGLECDDAIVGLVAVDGACADDLECEGRHFCRTDAEATCGGVCAAPLAENSACESDEWCESERCENGRCAVVVGEGEACPEPTPDATPTVCGDDLDCNDGVCSRGAALTFDAMNGQPCDFAAGTLCASGLFCGLSADFMTQSCKPQAEVGAACEIGLLNPCVANAVCDGLDLENMVFTGTCVALPAAGEPCRLEEGPDGTQQPGLTPCTAGLRCDPSTVTCARPKALGEACTDSSICLSSRCASDDAGQMVCLGEEVCELAAE